jgi:uncharacterized membrane protein
MAETKATPAKGTGLDPKVTILLCWLLAPITSLIFMLMDDTKKDPNILFNAKESLYYGIANIILFVFIIIPCIGWIFVSLGSLAFLVGRILIAVKAYNGEKVVLPLIGKWAEAK